MIQCDLNQTNGKKTKSNSDTTYTLSAHDKHEQLRNKKFKTAVQAVMNKIKILTKGNVDDPNLPDPAQMPITSSCHLSNFSLMTSEESQVTINKQEQFQDSIAINLSQSKTGACVLYRDKKTKNCVVKDISDSSSCSGFFEWYSCYHVMPESAKIIILDHNLNIVQAYHALLENHTRAAPVWDNAKCQFVAMFTITDFIRVLHKYYVADKIVLDNIPTHTIQDWRDMLGMNRDGRLIHVSPETNLRKAASVIVEHNIHRLPVIDPINGNVLAIITNSQLFKFFYERFLTKGNNILLESITRTLKISIPNYFKSKISDLKLGNYNESISTIHPWQTVFSAFEIFVNNHISVLPVVDEEHRLVDIYARYDVIVSIADTGKFLNLDWTISEALKLRKLVRPPCTCSKDDSFCDVLKMIYHAQVHRIFVVNSDRHILGVISLSDVISFLCAV